MHTLSDRLTPNWTPTLKEAFGVTGEVGREGELKVISILELNFGMRVIDFHDNEEMQNDGIDFAFKKPKWKNWYTGDLKTNMHSGVFYVEIHKKGKRGWLLKSQADRIFHYDLEHNQLIWYDINDMKEHMLGKTGLIRTTYKNISFIREWRKDGN